MKMKTSSRWLLAVVSYSHAVFCCSSEERSPVAGARNPPLAQLLERHDSPIAPTNSFPSHSPRALSARVLAVLLLYQIKQRTAKINNKARAGTDGRKINTLKKPPSLIHYHGEDFESLEVIYDR